MTLFYGKFVAACWLRNSIKLVHVDRYTLKQPWKCFIKETSNSAMTVNWKFQICRGRISLECGVISLEKKLVKAIGISLILFVITIVILPMYKSFLDFYLVGSRKIRSIKNNKTTNWSASLITGWWFLSYVGAPERKYLFGVLFIIYGNESLVGPFWSR